MIPPYLGGNPPSNAHDAPGEVNNKSPLSLAGEIEIESIEGRVSAG